MKNAQLVSEISSEGNLELYVQYTDFPKPNDDEVVVRVDGSPLNPSDMFLLFGSADLSTAKKIGTGDDARVVAKIPKRLDGFSANRTHKAICGYEGGGKVVAAGSSPEARDLLGKTVGVVAGAMYSQYRVVKASDCLVFPDGTSGQEAASCFVNPMTVLCMIESAKLGKHTGIVHTAAASNLGKMLIKACHADGIQLVNIVRREHHVELLHSLGAQYVLNSSEPDFEKQLLEALALTKATVCFDAIGGGSLMNLILASMDKIALLDSEIPKTAYGSSVFKQGFIYGGLDLSPTILKRNYGFSWSVAGWLVRGVLDNLEVNTVLKMRQRIVSEIKTTFASEYKKSLCLQDMLKVEILQEIEAKATGQKFLVTPNA